MHETSIQNSQNRATAVCRLFALIIKCMYQNLGNNILPKRCQADKLPLQETLRGAEPNCLGLFGGQRQNPPNDMAFGVQSEG